MKVATRRHEGYLGCVCGTRTSKYQVNAKVTGLAVKWKNEYLIFEIRSLSSGSNGKQRQHYFRFDDTVPTTANLLVSEFLERKNLSFQARYFHT